MDINSQFPSNFYKAGDLTGQARLVTMQGCMPEDIGNNEMKPVLRFVGEQKGLVLNKTNAQVIASFLGAETNAWIGQQIELYPTQVSFQGRVVDAIRVRQPVQPAAPVQTAPVQQPVAQPTAPTAVQPAAPVQEQLAVQPATQPPIVPDGVTAAPADFDDALPDFTV